MLATNVTTTIRSDASVDHQPFVYLACAEVSIPWTVSTDPHRLCDCCCLTCADVLLYLLLDVAVPLSVPCNELSLGLRHNYKLLVFRTFPAFLSNVVNNLRPCVRYLVMRSACYAVLPLQVILEQSNNLQCAFSCAAHVQGYSSRSDFR